MPGAGGWGAAPSSPALIYAGALLAARAATIYLPCRGAGDREGDGINVQGSFKPLKAPPGKLLQCLWF